MNNRLHIYYGYGKGKTTAALGLILRCAGAGRPAALVQFDKGFDGREEHYAERKILRALPLVQLFPYGKERVMAPGAFRFRNEPGDEEEARAGLAKAGELMEKGEQYLLVLDEILAAVMCRLLTRDEVMALLDLYEKNRRFELVLTGHQVWPELVERADLVTEMRKEKHYFDAQEPSKEGIEF